MEALLGNPTSTMQRRQQTGMSAGYCLFWRTFEGGTAYLNWTGSTQTITLPTGTKYYNPSGQVITQIQIPDATGTFVTTDTKVALPPQIMPRFSAKAAGVQAITITPPVSGAVIRYTENGTEPTPTSPIYSGPLQLATSAVIKARAYVTGETQSWESSASYTITSGSPTVEFVNTSDTGAAGSFHPLLVLSGIPESTVSVSYMVEQPNGTSTIGTATFLPGENYRYFNVTATGSLGQVATVRLNSASGAIVDSKDIFSITIN